ncbi:MAG: RNA methyltransferase, partial [Flavobacteriales bacterium]|nr:RNA methyltransferase [Flavobacteriales bacterium]
TNGHGSLFHASIAFDGKEEAWLDISDSAPGEHDVPFLTIAIAPTKNDDRLEWFVEKAVELGIKSIVLIECERSEKVMVRHERLQRIAISALKQSQGVWMPEITGPIRFPEALKSLNHGTRLIAHCLEDPSKKAVQDFAGSKSPVTVLIGPEGDFSPEEIQLAISEGVIPVTLGNQRLRTETAALAAVAIFDLLSHS